MKGAKGGKSGGRKGGKAAKGRKGGRRRRQNPNNVSEYASCSVKHTITDNQGQPFVVNRLYDAHAINLGQFQRAVQVAQAYQFFRIKKVAITLKFGYDTFQAGAGAATRPNAYYIIDKSQSVPATITLEAMKQMGARPHACDNKPFIMKWSPAVLTEDQAVGGPLPSQYKISPWLSTNAANLGAFVPSTVNHNGIYWYVDMAAVAGVQYNYTAEMEVQFEFKKPLWTTSASATPSLGIAIAVQNTSPDGVVGGADEGQDIGGKLLTTP